MFVSGKRIKMVKLQVDDKHSAFLDVKVYKVHIQTKKIMKLFTCSQLLNLGKSRVPYMKLTLVSQTKRNNFQYKKVSRIFCYRIAMKSKQKGTVALFLVAFQSSTITDICVWMWVDASSTVTQVCRSTDCSTIKVGANFFQHNS